MESTAMGIEAETVSPALSPTYTETAPNNTPKTEPNSTARNVNSGSFALASTYGRNSPGGAVELHGFVAILVLARWAAAYCCGGRVFPCELGTVASHLPPFQAQSGARPARTTLRIRQRTNGLLTAVPFHDSVSRNYPRGTGPRHLMRLASGLSPRREATRKLPCVW